MSLYTISIDVQIRKVNLPPDLALPWVLRDYLKLAAQNMTPARHFEVLMSYIYLEKVLFQNDFAFRSPHETLCQIETKGNVGRKNHQHPKAVGIGKGVSHF